MGDDITIGVTEIVNNIEVTAQPNDQIVELSVVDNADDVTLNITPTVIEINVNKGSSYAKWGTILGTLSDQEDLQDALDLKADLVDGKVPSSQLPSYVDDVIEVANYAALPTTGESGKIYITLDDNHIYRWTGSTYVEITDNTAVWGAITGTLSSQTDLSSALNAKALKTTTISTNSPLSGGGDLSANRTLSISQASASVDGYLSSTDWNTFNSKLSSLSGAVLTTTDQNISGVKTFTDLAKFTNGTGSFAIEIDVTTSGALVVKDTGTTKLQIGKNGEILAAKYKINGGFSSQFLKANGDLDSTVYTPASRTLTINGTSYDLSADRSWTIPTHDAVTISTSGAINGLSIDGSQQLSITTASSSSNGALSSTDWTTFNNKLSSLSGAVLTTTNQNIGGYKTFTEGAVILNNASSNLIDFQISGESVGNIFLSSSYTQFTSKASNGYLFKNTASENVLSITDSGNVGIGTTSPSNILTIKNNSAGTNGIDFQSFASSSMVGSIYYEQTNDTFNINNNSSFASGGIVLKTNNTERMRITSGGNVGIGTTSPLQKFDVDGLSYFRNDIYMQSNKGIFFSGNSAYGAGVYGANSGNDLVVNAGGNEKMRVTSSGNVGIGTSSPATKLEVAGAIRVNDGYGVGFALLDNSSITREAEGMSLNTNSTRRVLISATGNVGIGTTSPSSPLTIKTSSSYLSQDIIGDSTNGWTSMRFRNSSNSATTVYFNYDNNAFKLGTVGSEPITFNTTDTERMRITSTGNVGIGTTSPSYQLQLSTDSAAKPTSALWTIASDERIKENINSYTKGLNELLKINPITYDYNGLGGFKKGKGGVGIIAQEIAEILPDSVSSIKGKLNETDEEEIDILNFNGHELTYILINAVKELKAEIEILKKNRQ